MKPDLSNVRLVEPKPRPAAESKPEPAALPTGKPFFFLCKLDASHDATIHITRGQDALADHFEQPGKSVPPVPVVIRAAIMEAGERGRHSQAFSLFIRSITHEAKFYAEYPEPHDEDDPRGDFEEGINRLILSGREAGLSNKAMRHLLRHWADFLTQQMKHGLPHDFLTTKDIE